MLDNTRNVKAKSSASNITAQDQTPLDSDGNAENGFLPKDENETYSKEHGDRLGLAIVKVRTKIGDQFEQHKNIISLLTKLLIHLCILSYLTYAAILWQKKGTGVIDWCNGLGILLIAAVFIYWFVFYYTVIKPFLFPILLRYSIDTTTKAFKNFIMTVRISVQIILSIAFVIFILIDAWDQKRRLISLLGFGVFILLGYVFSKYPNRVPWKIVIWGVIMQLAIGLVTIRLSLGRYVLECIGHHVQTFLEFAYQGAAFVYGDEIVFVYHVFAFKVSIDFVQVPNVIY
ncbi:hypothetical protein M8J77_015149 [Diaphorina citri]|nr:hypothetical protein M8J77_015149 [Diaphorina citri]